MHAACLHACMNECISLLLTSLGHFSVLPWPALAATGPPALPAPPPAVPVLGLQEDAGVPEDQIFGIRYGICCSTCPLDPRHIPAGGLWRA